MNNEENQDAQAQWDLVHSLAERESAMQFIELLKEKFGDELVFSLLVNTSRDHGRKECAMFFSGMQFGWHMRGVVSTTPSLSQKKGRRLPPKIS